MVYIITESNDLMTDLVIDWFVSYNIPFKRINDNKFLNCTLRIDKQTIDKSTFSDATMIWHRRGKINLFPPQFFKKFPYRKPIFKYLQKELRVVERYIEKNKKIEIGKNYIGSYIKEIDSNKLYNLQIAQEIGFNIPKTIITTQKKSLIQFYLENKCKIITKDLYAPVFIQAKKNQLISKGVNAISKTQLNVLAKNFAPIFAQEYISKIYEIRVFSFQDKLFAMAIFSQNDEKTKIDYRNYNRLKPNRCVPFKLPTEIQKNIIEFLDFINLTTGSIDLIVTPEGKFYFLEVNTMGQFHWLSENCNYYLEKEIFESLSYYD